MVNYIIFALTILVLNVYGGVGGWSNPCAQSPLKGTPTCDTTKSFEQRAHDLVYAQEAGLANKGINTYQGLSGNTATAVSELNIPAYQWWSEALHGVANSPGVNYNGPIKYSTMFPQVITTGATFNASLFNMIGKAISTEARAMYNNAQAGLTFWAPNINIFRDPRWGRGQETPGEDPFLNSVYAGQFVSGMEGDNTKYIKASSCCKHYADYSMENSDGKNRVNFNAIVSDYDQNDTYLVAFKYCAITGNASGIMCSYNAENGIPSCANKNLMTAVMRNTWDFHGYITSDCGAVNDVQNAHHYTNSTGSTIEAVFSAGMDINCGGYTQKNTASAVSSGGAKLEDVQAAMYRATLVQMRLGLFDDPSMTPWSKLGPADVANNNTLQLSLEASRQGMVLLKNEKNILPLDKSKYNTVALIGPNAENYVAMKGNYAGTPPFIYTVNDGLKLFFNSNDITYVKGCELNSNDTSGIPGAVNAAKTADMTVLVMGIDSSIEGEGHDRKNIELPGAQNKLIQQVVINAKGPVVLVILSGGCVDISQWRDSDSTPGIIWGGYSGMFGGQAIIETIFGVNNPSGRLDQTWYYESYCDQIEMIDMNMRPNTTSKSPGRGYRYYNGSIVYPFGYGMSYTTFSCSTLNINANILSTTVKNTGNVDGSAVVLVFFIPDNAGQNGVPLKRLVGFGRVDSLSPSDSQPLKMEMYPEFYNQNQLQGVNGKYVLSGACQ